MSSRTEPLASYSFELVAEAVYHLPCKSVQTFKKENEYEYIQEGGLNDYVHILRKPVSQPSTLEIERYVLDGDDGNFDPLPKGMVLTMPLILHVSKWLGSYETSRRSYEFTGGVVTGKEYGGLDAEKPGLVIEKTSIAYQELKVINRKENSP